MSGVELSTKERTIHLSVSYRYENWAIPPYGQKTNQTWSLLLRVHSFSFSNLFLYRARRLSSIKCRSNNTEEGKKLKVERQDFIRQRGFSDRPGRKKLIQESCAGP